MNENTLDCKGLNCPMPIVKISRAMRRLQPGDKLTVEANDPSFKADVYAWVRKMGNEMLEFVESGDVQRAVICKR